MMSMNWNYPTTIWFGEKRINEIQKDCEDLNINKPLVVTDPGILKTNIIQKINFSLKDKANIFSDVQSNPTGNNVEKSFILIEFSGWSNSCRRGSMEGKSMFGWTRETLWDFKI